MLATAGSLPTPNTGSRSTLDSPKALDELEESAPGNRHPVLYIYIYSDRDREREIMYGELGAHCSSASW
jgi:hypothetical protein